MRIGSLFALAKLLLSVGIAGIAFGPGVLATESSAQVSCDSALATASRSNGMALFEGAAACAIEERQEDANFLIIVGQVRAMSDLTILTPLDDENAEKAVTLYSQLYYNFGGLGFDEVYRNPANVTALEKRVRNLALQWSEGYDPGWSYRSTSKTDIYSTVLSNERERRLWQMGNFALMLQDEAYYEAHRALQELQRNNPVLEQGTEAYARQIQLNADLAEASKGISALPPPPYDTSADARLNEPDPETAVRQVAAGFNGPSRGGTDIFRSEAEVRASWLAEALTDAELEALLGRTDFSKQVLVGYSLGERMNASGQIMISELGYHERNRGYTISTRIGVVPESCGVAFAPSYPFVVGVAEAVPGAEVMGSGSSNFGVDCGPIVSGTPAVRQTPTQ